jgi:hypothetical protein
MVTEGVGCLRAMVVRAGCSVLLAVALAVAFLYRDQILDFYHQWRGRGEVWVSPRAGGARQAAGAIQRLSRPGGPAYVDLSAFEIAAVIEDALARTGQRRVIDSLQVALLENEVRVRGSLDLSGVPRGLLGPLAGVVNDREPVTIGGPLSVDSSGQLNITVRYLQLRDFPFPRATIPRILDAARIPGVAGARVPLPGLPRVGDVRVSPRAVRLYRGSPP